MSSRRMVLAAQQDLIALQLYFNKLALSPATMPAELAKLLKGDESEALDGRVFNLQPMSYDALKQMLTSNADQLLDSNTMGGMEQYMQMFP